MASTVAGYGEIRATEAYTLEALAIKFNRTPRWVRDAFIRPVHPDTRERLTDPRTGKPIPPIPHWKQGGLIIILGQALLNWIAEYGWLTMGEDEDE